MKLKLSYNFNCGMESGNNFCLIICSACGRAGRDDAYGSGSVGEWRS